jgi:predicted DNA-binding transcriptional regulator AlpA
MGVAPHREVLPPSLAPRGLSRAQAAAYLCVSPGTFDRLVRDRLMPKPARIYGRVVWCRLQLDDSFTRLLNDNEECDGGEDGYAQRPTA